MLVLLFYRGLSRDVTCLEFTPGGLAYTYGKKTLNDHPSVSVAEWLETARPGDYEYFDSMWMVVIPDKE